MGTRGLYVYKWRGRYYVHYNQYDSFPEGLGRQLVGKIVSDSEAYNAWLERLRDEYTREEARLEHTLFSVDLEDIMAADVSVCFDSPWEMPHYVEPCNDLFIEWVYVFDLDNERFGVNGCAYYHLRKLPKDWSRLLGAANKVFFGDIMLGDAAHESITTSFAQTKALEQNYALQYQALNPTVVQIKPVPSNLTRRPATEACLALLDSFLALHHQAIGEARDTLRPDDFLFREVAFAILCMASRSPELVRFSATKNMVTKPKWSFAALFKPDMATYKDAEFMAKPFLGFHLESNRPGSAPHTECYWLLNVLICLRQDVDILCPAGVQQAVISVTARGRADGQTHFRAIIFSIRSFVLMKVVGSAVQHTKRMTFITAARRSYSRDFSNAHEAANEADAGAEEQGEEQNIKECCDSSRPRGEVYEHSRSFLKIAYFFELAQIQRLPPSSADRHGIFPNEVYEIIVKHTDRETRNACMTTSRAFRDYASEVFHMNDDLQLVARSNSENECFHPTTGFLGRFHLVVRDNEEDQTPREGKDPEECTMIWVPILGHPDGTAVFEPHITLQFDGIPITDRILRNPTKTVPTKVVFDSAGLDGEFEPAKMRQVKWRVEMGDAVMAFDYELFKKYLPNQRVPASAQDVAGVYLLVFFSTLGIMTSGKKTITWSHRSIPTENIGLFPIDTHVLTAKRMRSDSEGCVGFRTYALGWFKASVEDTVDGWGTAFREAREHATRVYMEDLYTWWVRGSSRLATDFAIFIAIGAKFVVLLLKRKPTIPPNLNPKAEYYPDSFQEKGNHELWKSADIDTKKIQKEVMEGWAAVDDINPYDERLEGWDYGRPLNVLKEEAKPYVEKAMKWLENLADNSGDQYTETHF